jgi:hypothetical protein
MLKFIVTDENEKVIVFKSNIKPEVGDYLHFFHLGGYQVSKIVHHISDDLSHAEDELLWIELICKKVKRKENE